LSIDADRRTMARVMQDSILGRLIAWVLLILGSTVCVWMVYLNVRDRWHEPADSHGDLPLSTDPRVIARFLVGGLSGTVAFLCAVFLFGWPHTRARRSVSNVGPNDRESLCAGHGPSSDGPRVSNVGAIAEARASAHHGNDNTVVLGTLAAYIFSTVSQPRRLLTT
jgi:hypothetical protein